jgi:hypothetical protein
LISLDLVDIRDVVMAMSEEKRERGRKFEGLVGLCGTRGEAEYDGVVRSESQ